MNRSFKAYGILGVIGFIAVAGFVLLIMCITKIPQGQCWCCVFS